MLYVHLVHEYSMYSSSLDFQLMGHGCHGMRGRNALPVVAMAREAGPGAAQTLHMLACLVVALRLGLGVAKASRHLTGPCLWPMLTFLSTPFPSWTVFLHCFMFCVAFSKLHQYFR